MPCRVILVRHGETSWNEEGRYLGQADPGLNEKGKTQAQAVAELLSQEEIELVFSSDLLRAVETSRVIAGVHNVTVKIIPSLREIDFGEWEGLNFEDIQTRYPSLLPKWLKNPFGVRIPGGETADEVRCRVKEAWNYITLIAAGEKAAVIVAHGGPLRILLCQLTGIDPTRLWDFKLEHGEAIVLSNNGSTYSILR
jgi:alpha-ribazole phosphatase